MSNAPRLVVRRHAPWRAVALIGGAVLLALVGVWLAFEWGRSRAGFDGIAARSERSSLKEQVAAQQKEVRALRLRLAMHETERAGQTRERTELSRSIGELQAEVARQRSELAFYQGVLGDRGTVEVLKIQQFRLTRGAQPGQYLVRLVLDRPLRSEDTIAGRVRITFEGSRNGVAENLDLAAAGVEGGELPFSYQRVLTLEQAVTLPAGFTPERTTVELVPARKGVNPVRETFLWNVED